MSRRQLLAGSALVGALATDVQASSLRCQRFNPTIAKVLLRHTARAVNTMSQYPDLDARPFAAAHAVAELALIHFEETGFSTMFDQHLAGLVPLPVPNPAELSAIVRSCGMRVSEDLLLQMLTTNAAGAVEAQQMGWNGLRPLLLRGFEVGTTTLTAPWKMYIKATWEPPYPRIIRRPLLLKDAKLAEELPRVRAAGKVAVQLGLALNRLAGSKGTEPERATDAAAIRSLGGAAAIGIGMAVFLICLHTNSSLNFTASVHHAAGYGETCRPGSPLVENRPNLTTPPRT